MIDQQQEKWRCPVERPGNAIFLRKKFDKGKGISAVIVRGVFDKTRESDSSGRKLGNRHERFVSRLFVTQK